MSIPRGHLPLHNEFHKESAHPLGGGGQHSCSPPRAIPRHPARVYEAIPDFDTHKVLVGVSGGSLQNLGVFGEEGTVMPSPNNPIERDASLRRAEENHSSDFADMIKGELAETLGKANRPGRDRRRRMLSELSSL